MKFEEVNSDHINSILLFCDSLKEQDSDPCSFWGYDKESVQELIADKDSKFIISTNENKNTITSMGLLKRGGPFQRHLTEISAAVHPKFRNAGLAKQLLDLLEKSHTEFKIDFIKALILENNLKSQSFFKKHGYEHKSTLFNEFDIEGVGQTSDLVFYKWFTSDS